MDLKTFGIELYTLRKRAQLSQEELVNALAQVAQTGPAAEFRVIDSSLLSRWEHARSYQGRQWKPTRQYVLYLIRLLVNPSELERAQQWGRQAGYQLSLAELQELFGSVAIEPAVRDRATSNNGQYSLDEEAGVRPEQPLSPGDRNAVCSLLESQADQQFFGMEAAYSRIYALLQTSAAPWLIAIDGIGGIGKTTLATRLAHEFVNSNRFANLAWVSAQQTEFLPVAGMKATGRPALDAQVLIDALLGQLVPQTSPSIPYSAKRALLLRYLKTQPCLVVVDNLETATDSAALLPELRQLANPSKFLITTRFSLRAEAGLFAYTVAELSHRNVLDFLRYEAATRNIAPMLTATAEQLTQIYSVVGGNPLALKLVIGQILCLPLAQVLANLEQARGRRVEALYNFIYWQAWHLLPPDERQLLLTLPLAPNGTFAQVALASGLAEEVLQEALARLSELSLVQLAGDLAEPRYGLHRLTETFLMSEVLKWQSTI